MKIQNVQNNQWISAQAMEGKANRLRREAEPANPLTASAENRSDVENQNLIPEHYRQQAVQEDGLQLVYPPFFPIGKTQTIYAVLNVPRQDGNAEQVTHLSAKGVGEQKTPENEPAARQADTQSAKEASLPETDTPAQTSPKADPGSVLDLKA